MTRPKPSVKNVLDTFVLMERFRFEIHHNNRFGFTFGKIQLYHKFLLVVLERYNSEAREAVGVEAQRWRILKQTIDAEPSGSREATLEEQVVQEESNAVATKLHLEIESFYVFSKIVLDHIARAIHVYFGQAHSCSLRSHDQFLKCLEKYMTIKQLQIPDGFRELGEFLKASISDYRDKLIEHEQDPDRFPGICHSQGMQPKIFSQRIEGTLETFKSTESLEALLARIEEYILLFLTLVKQNADKTTLKLSASL